MWCYSPQYLLVLNVSAQIWKSQVKAQTKQANASYSQTKLNNNNKILQAKDIQKVTTE
jgi:hypothetical protein